MNKTPDEIKKGLECCITDNCNECPYRPLYDVWGCKLARAQDALALIQQKEKENAVLVADNGKFLIEVALLQAKMKQLEAERDAAVKDIRLAFTMHLGTCNTCLYFEDRLVCDAANICALCEDKECVCNNCDNDCSNWQWRGVQKEE